MEPDTLKINFFCLFFCFCFLWKKTIQVIDTVGQSKTSELRMYVGCGVYVSISAVLKVPKTSKTIGKKEKAFTKKSGWVVTQS
jgi:hypothetical protein